MLTGQHGFSAGLLMLFFAGCAAEVTAPQATAPQATSPEEAYVVVDGKVDQTTYIGWQVFQENCARCHGPAATGTEIAPDLTERINHLSQDQFRLRVLSRYFITVPLDEAVAEGSGAMEQAMEEAVEAREARPVPAIDMPRWRDNPDVRDHIRELYAWLTARADGVLGPGAPELLPK